jgi:hypothetical protein
MPDPNDPASVYVGGSSQLYNNVYGTFNPSARLARMNVYVLIHVSPSKVLIPYFSKLF